MGARSFDRLSDASDLVAGEVVDHDDVVLAQGWDPIYPQYYGVTVTTSATYSPPLLIGITLDQTGYRGPGYARLAGGATSADVDWVH